MYSLIPKIKNYKNNLRSGRIIEFRNFDDDELQVVGFLRSKEIFGYIIGDKDKLCSQILRILKHMNSPLWDCIINLDIQKQQKYDLREEMIILYNKYLQYFQKDLRKIIISYIHIPINQELLKMIVDHPDYMLINYDGTWISSHGLIEISKHFELDNNPNYFYLNNLKFSLI